MCFTEWSFHDAKKIENSIDATYKTDVLVHVDRNKITDFTQHKSLTQQPNSQFSDIENTHHINQLLAHNTAGRTKDKPF